MADDLGVEERVVERDARILQQHALRLGVYPKYNIGIVLGGRCGREAKHRVFCCPYRCLRLAQRKRRGGRANLKHTTYMQKCP